VIVSASRRTDLPALHAPWLLERLAAGYVSVQNPYAPSQVRRVDLVPAPAGTLTALVLWTRNPGPLLPAVPEWEARGLRTLWLVTVTGYPRPLEPRAPESSAALDAVQRLAALVGRERVAWRYDPMLLCPALGMDREWHARNFRRLAAHLGDASGRCIVSLYDDYPKARRRLSAAGLEPDPETQPGPLLSELAAEAGRRGLAVQTCCEAELSSEISPGACIDGALLDRLWGLGIGPGRDRGQRPGCRCAPSVDIGAYDTCTHGCLYCYATGSRPRSSVSGLPGVGSVRAHE
jgi:hypothetical protein